jgi:hypothetical protein
MRSDEFNEPEEHSRHRGGRFELFFYEQVGTRYYLRFTRLALALVICLTVIPILAIFALFFTQRHTSLENVNVEITVPPQTPRNYEAPIIQPPPVAIPAPPKAGRSQRSGEPARQTPAAPSVNANAPTTPSRTPSPTPAKPPG